MDLNNVNRFFKNLIHGRREFSPDDEKILNDHGSEKIIYMEWEPQFLAHAN